MPPSRTSRSHSAHKSTHLTNESTIHSESSHQSTVNAHSPNQHKRRAAHQLKKKHKSSSSSSSNRSERPKTGIFDRLRLFISSTMNNLSNSIASINQTITSTVTRPHDFEPDVPIYLLGDQFKHSESYHLVNKSATDSPTVSADVAHPSEESSIRSNDRRTARSNSQPNAESVESLPLASMLELWHSMIWLTYRTGFEPIRPSLTSDAGWGCMIRTTQMMIAAALSRMWLGRQFRLPEPSSSNQSSSSTVDQSNIPSLYINLLSLFIDSPNAPFSLHAMLNDQVTVQSSNQSSIPVSQPHRAGEWFGPTTTCHMVSRCASRLHADRSFDELMFPRVYITDDQTVYLDEIQSEATSSQSSTDSKFQPLLVLVPSRLGADRVNPSYQAPLLRTFTCPSSLGLLGGKPRTSLYFAGCQGQRLLYLDPHTVNPSVESRDSLNDANVRQTFHSQQVRSLPFDQLDPSLALGFIMTNQTEFDRWLDDLKQMEKEFESYALVRVRDMRQKLNDSADDAVLTEDDDDEFVVL